MRYLRMAALVLALASTVFAQTGNSAIGGVIAGAGGSPISGATVEARNVATGVLYRTASTVTGYYSVSALPAGVYELAVAVNGYKRYIRQNIALGVARSVRLDAMLEPGAATDLTIVADA